MSESWRARQVHTLEVRPCRRRCQRVVSAVRDGGEREAARVLADVRKVKLSVLRATATDLRELRLTWTYVDL